MSVYAVERFLWDLCNVPDRFALYRADPEKMISDYRLSEAEKRMLSGLKVRALMDYQVNPMLIMTAWNALIGSDKIGEYLAQLNAPAKAAEA
jgi:hypothetical protein